MMPQPMKPTVLPVSSSGLNARSLHGTEWNGAKLSPERATAFSQSGILSFTRDYRLQVRVASAPAGSPRQISNLHEWSGAALTAHELFPGAVIFRPTLAGL